MPSKAPSATALGPASGGKDSSPRTICMKDANGLDPAPTRDQLSNADHRAVGVMDPHQALGCGGRNHVGRLAVAERRRAVPVQADGRPAVPRGLDRPYPGPEVAVPLRQLAPRDRVWQGEGADPPA